jgi:starch synthase
MIHASVGRPWRTVKERRMRVVCISAECEPWAKTGGLGDVVDALARAVGTIRLSAEPAADTVAAEPAAEPAAGPADDDQETLPPVDPGRARPLPQTQVWMGTGAVMHVGAEGTEALGEIEPPVDVFLPRYRGMEVPANATIRPLSVPDPTSPEGITDVKLVEFEARGYRVRLIDHPPAFDRDDYYGGPGGDYPDNGWRFGLLCRGTIEALLLDERPVDVIHLHDWQAMPTAVLRDVAYEGYPLVTRAAIMATIHNLAYQGWLSRDQAAGMFFADEIAQAIPAGADGILLLREGVTRAELSNTVSPGYAEEVLRPEFGMNMDPVLRGLGHRFGGILNGLDMALWDPAADEALPARYSRTDLAGKAECRRALLEELGFDAADESPLLGMIGRLDPQKGFDLLAQAALQIVAAGGRIVALGTGDKSLVARLQSVAAEHPRSVAVVEKFDRALARRIYAGADLFVMPSRFEPCGQGQMIAMRYGTPPIVHRTGGLADTVVDEDEHPGEGTGFVHVEASAAALVETCWRAMDRYRAGGAEWAALQDRGMLIDWSWEAGPAEQYVASYRRAVSLRRER